VNERSGDPLFSAQRWAQVRASLDELEAQPPDVRRARLQEIAGSDADLAASLQRLLTGPEPAAAQQTDAFLDPAWAPADAMPERIGPFRLRQRIGVGGMGVVYLAEREHADFTQRVALKLLDAGASNLARLAARERRILSALAHPNITALVDAGVDQGRAWIAMEYVDGDSLLDHCRNLKRGLRERVRLFDQVCAAVAHAHAQLIVHRDLKPSNVLVNTAGNAKLLDFGIALALESTDESAPATRVFTPEYAAPEQLRGERVTTATDVHALGLILYELVCQRRLPVLERGSHNEEWTGAELARMASTHPATIAQSATSDAAFNFREISAALRGDLGRIIAHALNPEPGQRYASVALLREDLARWLDHRPLTIVRPSALYVVRRFARRHRLGMGLAAAGLLAIFGLAAAALWQARAKGLEASRAQVALRQSEATRDFVSSMFLAADPYLGKGLQTTAADLLSSARKRVDAELADEPEVATALLSQIASVYVSQTDNAATREVLGKVLEYNARSAQPSLKLEAASKARLAFIDYLEFHQPEKREAIDAAVRNLRELGADAHVELGRALVMHANLLLGEDQQDAALAASTEAVQLLRPLAREHAFDYLWGLLAHADLMASLDRNEEAVAAADEGLATPQAQQPDYTSVRLELLGARARGLAGLLRYAEAEPVFAQIVDMNKAAFGFESPQSRYWRYQRAQLMDWMGQLEEAHAEIERLLNVPASGAEHPMASIAARVELLRIENQQRVTDLSQVLSQAKSAACGEGGAPQLCAKVKLIDVENLLRSGRTADARVLLAALGEDAAFGQAPSLAAQLLLLRARSDRLQGQFEAAGQLLAEARSKAATNKEIIAEVDVEQGYLALATGDRIGAVEALSRGGTFIAALLKTPTPQVREIDAAIARAKREP
jgi:predicted Ser/Thr protein kinase